MGAFLFKQFSVDDAHCGMKIGTDSVLLGAWAQADAPKSIIDLGAGSGLLALMMAQRFPQARVVALEIDADACVDAHDNFTASPWASRLSLVNCDAMACGIGIQADLIVCNPPYFLSELKSPDLKRAAARHASSLGIASAMDFAKSHLAPQGQFAMVTPSKPDVDVVYEAEMRGLKLRRCCQVSTSARKGAAIALWQFALIDGGIEKSEISIRAGQDFTNEYKELTKDFYLKF